MSNFDDLLTAAESAPVPSRTVRVCIDPTVAEKRAVLLRNLEQARLDDSDVDDDRLGAEAEPTTERTDAAVKALEDFDSEVQKSLITLKFNRLPGERWALLTSAYPMRIDVALDRHYGYNYDAVTEKATRLSGVRVDADEEHPIVDEQWDRLLKILSGHDVEQIRDAVWTLNEYEPSQHIEALVKGFGAA
jgi:hypothetical protein